MGGFICSGFSGFVCSGFSGFVCSGFSGFVCSDFSDCCKTSYGDFPPRAVVGSRFCRYAAVFTISAQNGIGIFASSIIDLALVFNDCIILSETPFMFCVYGGLNSKIIPWSVRVFLKIWLSYSPLPLSQRNRLIWNPGY